MDEQTKFAIHSLQVAIAQMGRDMQEMKIKMDDLDTSIKSGAYYQSKKKIGR